MHKQDIFAQAPNEVDRLQSWARSWEPETEAMLDRIQVQPGWHAIDLACGPLGIIGPLSRRVVLPVEWSPQISIQGCCLPHATALRKMH